MPKIGENIGTVKCNLAVGLRHNIDKGIHKCKDEDTTSVCCHPRYNELATFSKCTGRGTI